MDTTDIARQFTVLCKEGKFSEAGERFWADDVVSVEAQGDSPESRGKEAVRAKGEWWESAHEVHGAETHGPYVNGDQFAVRFVLDVTVKESGERITMDEVGLYSLADGKIVEERFYY